MRRRELLQAAGFVVGTQLLSIADVEEARGRVRTASEPSQLRITDLRVVPMHTGLRSHVVRLDTNQGISGYGEIRDGASPTYALLLKSRLLGENPCHVDQIFRKLKQFGGHARQAGGVVAIEIACWDLAGKAWGVPCWQLLGGKFRDRIRMYADTTAEQDAQLMGRRLKERCQQGFTFLKMDLGIRMLRGVAGALSFPRGNADPFSPGPTPLSTVPHPFTGIRLSERGLQKIQEYVAVVRDVVGWEVPLAADHFGHIGTEDAIKLARALDPFNLAWL